ncbi:hypothetical protein ACFQV2_32740 [Actinokineospora soli]|uniref:Uncharacterized protein n=1 Tax=Actinokineospora soli TaxID=1048753 RepID=A0ABW2TW75_9PSEU
MGGDEVVVERYPAAVARYRQASVHREHVLVAEDTELDTEVRDNAEVVVSSTRRSVAEARRRVDVLLADMFCSLAGAAVDDGLVLRFRHGPAWRVRARGGHAALVAAAVHAWLVARPHHTGDFRFTARAGDLAVRVRAIPLDP